MKRNKLVQFILSLLFPSFCAGCGAEGGFLCPACERTCVILRAPTKHASKSSIALTYAATEYRQQPIVQRLIATLKYRGAKDTANHCADLIIAHLRHARFSPPPDTIMTAVPLHARRLRERGFNQADRIARIISKTYGIPYTHNILARIAHTPAQAHMDDRKKRLENMRGAFVCAGANTARGKTVVIVDDVMTTGATLEACAQALKEAGAQKIIACVVAK